MFTIGDSRIHAKGLFANEFIPAKTRIIEYQGEHISKEEAARREKINDAKGTTYIFDLNETTCIDGEVNGNEAQYINHSCSPNCELDFENDHIYIIAARDISPGEELSYDYAFDPEPNPVPCICGSSSCRGTINVT